MPCRTRAELVKLFVEAAAEANLANEGTVYLTAKSIRIESDMPVPVQLDGDLPAHALDISLLPVRLPFIVPSDPDTGNRQLTTINSFKANPMNNLIALEIIPCSSSPAPA